MKSRHAIFLSNKGDYALGHELPHRLPDFGVTQLVGRLENAGVCLAARERLTSIAQEEILVRAVLTRRFLSSLERAGAACVDLQLLIGPCGEHEHHPFVIFRVHSSSGTHG